MLRITVDCWNVHMLAGWWAQRLGYVVDDAHDVVRELLAAGAVTPDEITTVNGRLAFADAATASDPAGAGPRMHFQAVEETKFAKNRVHLDIDRGGRELAEVVDDYVEAGAAFTGYAERLGSRWAAMADPEGNEFCIR